MSRDFADFLKAVQMSVKPDRRPRITLKAIGAICAAFIMTSCHNYSTNYAIDDSLRKGATLRVPREFQKGTASLDQAKAWANALLMGSGEIEVDDFELIPHGRPVLYISDRSNAGTGGNFGMVFEQTPKGLRYLGDIDGGYSAVNPDSLGRPRGISSWHMGGVECRVTLWVLTAKGFEDTNSITVRHGDAGPEEGNRLYDALFGPIPVSDSLIEKTFGPATATPQ